MKLYAPKYYEDFKCIADKCTHSCCVGWEIDIDSNTLKKYNALEHKYAEKIKSSIDFIDTPHFILKENDRCPHLNECGLCEIINNVGEEFLCDICREHPRFYNFTNYGKEVGLGMSCEEACRIILCSDCYDEMIEIDEIEGEIIFCDFDPIPLRKTIYSLLCSTANSYEEKLTKLYKITDTSPHILTDNEWKAVFSELEYLDDSHKELFLKYAFNTKPLKELEPYLERALAYFIYRHCSEACNEDEFYSCLGFSMLCERLLCSICKDASDVFACARIISEELEYSQDNTDRIIEEFL